MKKKYTLKEFYELERKIFDFCLLAIFQDTKSDGISHLLILRDKAGETLRVPCQNTFYPLSLIHPVSFILPDAFSSRPPISPSPLKNGKERNKL